MNKPIPSFNFGDIVKIKAILKRVKGYKSHYWKSYPCDHQNCIFLGYRTLYNGTVIYDEYEGVTFTPQEHFGVIIVAINSYTNPVYVDKEDVYYQSIEMQNLLMNQ